MLKSIGAIILAASIAFFVQLSPARSECPECRDWCGFGPQGDACMGTCQCDFDGPQAEAAISFGAIAHSFGDGHTSKSMGAATSKEASDLVLGHCRSNSGVPDRCKVVTWYVNSCGALAIGDTAFAALGGGNDAIDLTRGEAEAAALDACRKLPGNGGCKVEYSGCSDDLTPEEAAENEQKKAAVVDMMAAGLCALFNAPGCAAQIPAAPGPTPSSLAAQVIQICTPTVQDRQGNFWPSALKAIENGAMKQHFSQINDIVNSMKNDAGSQLNKLLSDNVSHVQLTVSLFDNPKKHVSVNSVTATDLRCGPDFRTATYDAQKWMELPDLSPNGLSSQ